MTARALAVALLAGAACDGGKDDTTGDTGTDTVTDTDTDTQTPGDDDDDDTTGDDDDTSSADGALVVPDGDGLSLYGLDGTLHDAWTWDTLLGGCTGCGGEGANPDGDGLVVAFTTLGPAGQGGVARLDAAFDVTLRVDGLAFPHAAVPAPDGGLVVAETSADRLVWLDAAGEEVRDLTGFAADLPNGLRRLSVDGHELLVFTLRGGGGGPPGGGTPAAGGIALWDVTDPDAPTEVWHFPDGGSLDTPHGPLITEIDGEWWLLYAHTEGGDDGTGAVGLARLGADPRDPPAYVADLVPSDTTFGFLRGVEIVDGTLVLTDSGGPAGGPGGGGAGSGRVLTASWPTLAATGASGGVGDQVFVDLGTATPIVEGLLSPFEAWWWAR